MKKFLSLIVVGILFIACQPTNELGTPFQKGQEVSLTASIGEQRPQMMPSMQRVSGKDDPNNNKIDLTWDEGDQILVKVGNQSSVFTLAEGAGTGDGTFNGFMPADGSSFHVEYPVEYSDEVLKEQIYVENGFGKGLMKMSTQKAGTIDQGFTLSPENAVLGLQFSGDVVVSKIEVTNMAAEEMYTLDCSNQPVATAHSSTLFYMVVPAGTWSNGMKVEVYNATGVVIESRTKAGEIVFAPANAMIMDPLQLHDISYKLVEVEDEIFKMVFVEGGTFTMGRGQDEHQVTLSDYYMSECELTQAQWEAVMGEKPQNGSYKIEKYGDHYPMSGISLTECQAFVDRLNVMTGLHFRIPTEAEWEYAARGGKKSKGYIYAGSNDINEVAIYAGTVRRDENGEVIYAPEPVMTRKPNELGMYDMSGNLCEWVSDWTGGFNLYPQINPTGRAVCLESNPVMHRGGCWTYADINCQSTSRKSFPNHGANGVGLRLVLSDEEPFKMVYLDDLTRIVLRPVKGGTFKMGSDAPDAEADEKPVHKVTLSDFYIGETEVTQHLWEKVMGDDNNPSAKKGTNLPVTNITWDECQTFVEKLSEMTGMHFRLPTEAEWEYAARGGQKSKGYTYAGSDAIDEVAWYKENSNNQTHAVGQKQPNELGIYDMTGNVWEYCYDWHSQYTDQAQTNPMGATTGEKRVLRGGCYHYDSKNCTNTNRHSYYTPDNGGASTGLRIVLEVKK